MKERSLRERKVWRETVSEREGRQTEIERNRGDERERERGERNCLNLSSFILTPPPPHTNPWMWDRITLHGFALANSGDTWDLTSY